ncbi:MAG TPA: hypothetical protein VGC37_13050, partial [Friedmanniella sp.]
MSQPTNGDNAKAAADGAEAGTVTAESDANAPVKGAVAEGESRPDTGTDAGSRTGPGAAVSTDSTDAAQDQAETDQGVAVVEPESEVLRVQHGMFGVKGTGDTSGYGGLSRAIDFPASTQQPFGGWWDDVYDRMGEVAKSSSDVIEKVVVHRGEITFHVVRGQLA